MKPTNPRNPVIPAVIIAMLAGVPTGLVSQPADVPPDSTWKTVTDPVGVFTLRYPATLLELTVNDSTLIFTHKVPYVHTYQPHALEPIESEEFTDFYLEVRFDGRTLGEITTDHRNAFPEIIHGDKIELEPGYSDKVCFGDLEGYRITIGAHFSCRKDYYLRFGKGYVTARRFCYFLWERGRPETVKELSAIPGIILERTENGIFTQILASAQSAGE